LMLQEAGISFENRLFLSDKAHLVLPIHKMLDSSLENAKTHRIGSTQKGIGPAYSDKFARYGIRLADLANAEQLAEKVKHLLSYHHLDIEVAPIVSTLMELAEFFAPYVASTEYLLNEWHADGKKILFEGAQGTLLDIDFGSYPYVTSSHPLTAAASVGSGLAYNKLGRSIGIMKAYCTRVGIGAFPSELKNETGDEIRKKGNEFGSTTGRPRRCGWLDLVAMRYSAMINGFDELALTLLDVLSGFESVKFCTAYQYNGQQTAHFPANNEELNQCQPIWTELPGWSEDISHCQTFAELPKNAQNYIEYIEKYLGIPITLISVGPQRQQTIFKG